MYIHIKFLNTTRINVYFHNRDQLVVPNMNSVFGSSRVFYDTRGSLNEMSWYASTVHLEKVEETILDKPGGRCNASATAKSDKLAACVAQYIERKVGCS